MSVVGIDVGNESGIVAVARQRGIDVVLNDESKRETPVIVSFSDQQRFIGVAGAASQMMNPKNTVTQIKRLIGKKFRDPSVQADIATFPFSVTEGDDGEPIINVRHLNKDVRFTPVQVLAMALSNLKSIGEKNLEAKVVDCVLGIPAYFTESQRRAYLDAAAIAGLNPLRLLHETTATALAYGLYKTDLPETETINVAFVDVGHASLQVAIVAFKKGQLKILSHAFDDSLGGRDFDQALFNHFADEFKVQYKIDVRSNARASLRLRAACEKLKKVLSANPEAPLNIECLMDEKDVRSHMKRDLFEQLAAPVLERVKKPCLKAIEDAGIAVGDISQVEVVGSGSRVPAILKILVSVFGLEPKRTLNASECIARGCALQCAMLSPTFKVKDFEVQDVYPFPVILSWKQDTAPDTSESGDAVPLLNQTLFAKNCVIPCSRLLTYYRSNTFSLDADYGDGVELPSGVSRRIGTFTIGPLNWSGPGKAKLKVKFRMNLHGIISLDTAAIVEEEEVDGPDGVKPESDVPMDDAEAAAPSPAAGAEKVEVVKKKKVKRTEVPAQTALLGGLPVEGMRKAVEEELEMALQDRIMEETKDKKNSVEAYVYEMRNKLSGSLQEYILESDSADFLAKLQDTEDWLYEDGENEKKSVYVAKLEELRKIGDPIEVRLREEESRPDAISQLAYCITSFKAAAASTDPRYEHIDSSEKAKVIEECKKAEIWLAEKQFQQSLLRKTDNPVLFSAEVRSTAEKLDRFCKPIMTKPAPKPQPPPQPAAEAAKPTSQPDGDAMETDAAPAAGDEPMQTD